MKIGYVRKTLNPIRIVETGRAPSLPCVATIE